MRKVMMDVGLFTYGASFPLGQMPSGRKFPAVLALPSGRDGAQRRACTCRSSTATNLLNHSEDGGAPDAVINAS